MTDLNRRTESDDKARAAWLNRARTHLRESTDENVGALFIAEIAERADSGNHPANRDDDRLRITRRSMTPMTSRILWA